MGWGFLSPIGNAVGSVVDTVAPIIGKAAPIVAPLMPVVAAANFMPYLSGHQVNEARKNKRRADMMLANQQKEFDTLLAEKDDQMKKVGDERARQAAGVARDTAKARVRALIAGGRGRNDTILTGPLGVPGQVSNGSQSGKTLLGY